MQRPRARGAIFVVALLILALLSGMTLVFARQMRVEMLASNNILAAAQAEAIARGAAQAVMTLEETMPGDAVPLGDGGFWIIHPDYNATAEHVYGSLDESAKLNLNIATLAQLRGLPGMTDEIAAAIIDWRDGDDEPTEMGAESDYYLMLDDPYVCKNAPFETVAELRLVRGITDELYRGEDRNRNGILDVTEDDDHDGQLDFGLVDLVTVYSQTNQEDRINVNENDANQSLQQALTDTFEEDRGMALFGRITGSRPHRNLIDLFYKAGFTVDEFGTIAARLRTSDDETLRGQVNITAAPRDVVLALGVLEEGDVDNLIAYRQSLSDGTSIVWITDVLEREVAIALGDYLVDRGDRRSADIVAVGARGRAFERYRVVYDNSGETPTILAWQRLTYLGWPLDREVLDGLRDGEALDSFAVTADRGSF
jgi:hypothetical protein